jgi:amino acid transporter
MRLRWVTALGASISVGLGVYILLGPLLLVAGQQSLGPPYLVMAIIAVPIILTYAERAGVTPGSGGAYNLARMSGLVWLT